MAALDWIFASLLLASLLLGAWRGLVYELCSLAGWVLGFIAARWWAQDVGAWLPMGDAQALWRPVAGFVLVFIGVVFASGLLAWAAKKLLQAVGLRPADRALGALFGVLRAVLLLLLLALLARWSGVYQQPWWKDSIFAPLLQALLVAARPLLPEPLVAALSG